MKKKNSFIALIIIVFTVIPLGYAMDYFSVHLTIDLGVITFDNSNTLSTELIVESSTTSEPDISSSVETEESTVTSIEENLETSSDMNEKIEMMTDDTNIVETYETIEHLETSTQEDEE